MELIHTLLGWLHDPGVLIKDYGYVGMTLVIFLETGAMVFFLPGDSLLVTAGVFAAGGQVGLSWGMLNLLLIPAAILGDATSYFIGARTGPAIFNRPESRFFKPQHLKAAHDFYERHGGKAIIIARFMPLVRTFVPVVAGVGAMPYRRFALFNVIGAASWVLSMTSLGYGLGAAFPWVAKKVELVIIIVVFLSILPGIIAWMRRKKDAPAPVPPESSPAP
jgi:membrane-associated protein